MSVFRGTRVQVNTPGGSSQVHIGHSGEVAKALNCCTTGGTSMKKFSMLAVLGLALTFHVAANDDLLG